MTNKQELDLYFRFCCEKGMEWRGLAGKEEYEKRLKHETEVITTMDFAGYFLIICDLLDWCRENKIPLGTGRGSAGGSLACFCLNITQLDPLKYGLIFERFLDYTRTDSYPDIDLDFGKAERHLVLQYLADKFGTECVTGIGTYGTMKTKGAIRSVTRGLGYPYDIGDELAKLTLPPISGKEQPLSVCYEQVPELRAAKDGEAGPEKQEILEAAEWMEGRIQNFGQHASGFIIADFPVNTTAPLAKGSEDFPVCQTDMNDLEALGLIKFDILGLKTLSIMKTCMDLVEARQGKKLDLLEFPIDDKETYDLICSGDVLQVFQLTGSSGLQSFTSRMRPRNLDDISLLCATYRPGPLSSGLSDQIIQVRNGEKEAEYFLPELEPILKDTAGCIVYQEQLMAIGRELAGYDAAETNRLRKATAKKKKKLMDEQQERFTSGMAANGFEKGKATQLFNNLVDFSSYSFNRSHSALYGYISFQTAYLKVHYLIEFICACLIHEADNNEEVYKLLSYCKKRGISILPPDINKSEVSFSIDIDENKKDGILFGLGVIKNVGIKAMEKVDEARQEKKFDDIFDFCARCPGLNRKMLTSLVNAGAFDSLHGNRMSLLDGIEDIWRHRQDTKAYNRKMDTYHKNMEKWRDREKLKAEGAKLPSLKKPSEPQKPIPAKLLPSLQHISRFEQYKQEIDLLGYYLSGHPTQLVISKPDKVVNSIEEMKTEAQDGQRLSILAVPTLIEEKTTRKTKQKMAYVVVEDETDTIDLTFFPKTWNKVKPQVELSKPAVFAITLEVLGGKKEEDEDAIVDAIVKGKVFTIKDINFRQEETNASLARFRISAETLYKERRQIQKLTKKGEVPVQIVIEGKNGTDLILSTKTNNLPLFQRLLTE